MSLAALKPLQKSRSSCAEIVQLASRIQLDSSEEALAARETIAKAALDTGRVELADKLVSELETRFPKSQRVGMLRGLVLEAEGKFLPAETLYKGLMVSNPSNIQAAKRIAALKRDSVSSSSAAMQALNALLQDNHADIEVRATHCTAKWRFLLRTKTAERTLHSHWSSTQRTTRALPGACSSVA